MKCSDLQSATAIRSPQRRRLLQLGASAVPLVATGAVGGNETGPVAPQAYSGPGYYLYPAWGTPALYHVSAVSHASTGTTALAFRDPVGGELLWVQSLPGAADFAARLPLPA